MKYYYDFNQKKQKKHKFKMETEMVSGEAWSSKTTPTLFEMLIAFSKMSKYIDSELTEVFAKEGEIVIKDISISGKDLIISAITTGEK